MATIDLYMTFLQSKLDSDSPDYLRNLQIIGDYLDNFKANYESKEGASVMEKMFNYFTEEARNPKNKNMQSKLDTINKILASANISFSEKVPDESIPVPPEETPPVMSEQSNVVSQTSDDGKLNTFIDILLDNFSKRHAVLESELDNLKQIKQRIETLKQTKGGGKRRKHKTKHRNRKSRYTTH